MCRASPRRCTSVTDAKRTVCGKFAPKCAASWRVRARVPGARLFPLRVLGCLPRRCRSWRAPLPSFSRRPRSPACAGANTSGSDGHGVVEVSRRARKYARSAFPRFLDLGVSVARTRRAMPTNPSWALSASAIAPSAARTRAVAAAHRGCERASSRSSCVDVGVGSASMGRRRPWLSIHGAGGLDESHATSGSPCPGAPLGGPVSAPGIARSICGAGRLLCWRAQLAPMTGGPAGRFLMRP